MMLQKKTKNKKQKKTKKHKSSHYVFLRNIVESFLYVNVCTVLAKFIVNNKLIIDTRTKFSIYARLAFRLQKTHQ